MEREIETACLLTLKDAADRLKVPLSWLYSRTRIRDNGFPVIRVGKYCRVRSMEELLSWIERNQVRG